MDALIKQLFTFLLVFVSFYSTAQKKIDYWKIRDDLRPPLCGFRDSLSTTEVYANLLALDTTTIKKHIGQYYRDLSEMEYLLCMYRHDTTMMRNSALNSVKAIYHESKSQTALWSAAFCFGHLGECEKMRYYLNLYRERIPKKYHSQEQIALLEQECD